MGKISLTEMIEMEQIRAAIYEILFQFSIFQDLKRKEYSDFFFFFGNIESCQRIEI